MIAIRNHRHMWMSNLSSF